MNHDESTNPTRLESWKEIAAYLQRDSTTARRWEKEEGLPVHRHSHKSRSSVYAYASEIDEWRASRKVVAEPAPPRPLWKLPAFAVTMVMCLIMVGNGIRPVSAQSGAPAARLVWNVPDGGADVLEGGFSLNADGRWLALDRRGDGVDLTIRDMNTGHMKRLAVDAGPPVISPDGRQVAFNFFGKDEWRKDDNQTGQLRVMATEPGSKPKILFQSPDMRYSDAAAFSPDGKSLLAILVKQDWTRQLAWVSLADGAVKQLKSLGWRFHLDFPPSISPDGRYIAYTALAVAPQSNSRRTVPTDQHIYVIASDGSSESEVVGGTSINEAPVWTPDGAHLLFVSNRKGASFDLWSIGVRNGKASGLPKLVREEGGHMTVVGMTRSGSFYYENNVQAIGDEIFIQDLDSSGKVRGTPSRLTENFPGSNVGPVWSPDGKSVAFKRRQPGEDARYKIVVRSMASGQETLYPLESGQRPPRWFHDGKSLLQGNKRIDLATKESMDVSLSDPSLVGSAVSAVSPNDHMLYIAARSAKAATNALDRIISLDLASGQQKQVFALPQDGSFLLGFALSPDGKTFVATIGRKVPEGKAFAQDNEERLVLVGVDGSGYKELYSPYKLQAGPWGEMLAWTPDGRSILFAQAGQFATAAYGVAYIMRIPAVGGKPEPTGLELKGSWAQISLSPDGSRIAYNTHDDGVRQLWRLDNVLSLLK
jgi:Tol biopolymer transport system component